MVLPGSETLDLKRTTGELRDALVNPICHRYHTEAGASVGVGFSASVVTSRISEKMTATPSTPRVPGCGVASGASRSSCYDPAVLSFDAPLTFREFMTHEDLPLATVFRDLLELLASRPDAVLFGAQAVNAYCETERMTHDIDVMSTEAGALAEVIRSHLAAKFHIAVRLREIGEERAYRVYQLRKPRNRHLADIRQVDALPAFNEIAGVRVATPVELLAMKVMSMAARRNRPKGDTDRADLRRLLLAFPDLKVEGGPVASRLCTLAASDEALGVWSELVAEQVEPDEEEGW